MGAQKKRLLLVQRNNYTAREAFLLCETEGCRNAVAAWAIPEGYSGSVRCTLCVLSQERE